MASEWYVRIGKTEHGPLSSERLVQLTREGKITPETPVRKGPSSGWAAASAVKGLFAVGDGSASPAAIRRPTS